MKRYLFLSLFMVAAVLFAWGSAFAADVPEFDAVGCDSTNYFVDLVMSEVISNNLNSEEAIINHIINHYSIFDIEKFVTTAGLLSPDPCFRDYHSALTRVYDNARYEWYIVLQMKPGSDINLEIRDCVLKSQSIDIWTGAWQTGRFRTSWGQMFFVPAANPRLTVRAFPGPYATPGFRERGFFLDARVGPSLERVVLDRFYYSSKSLWAENILIALPETGGTNGNGQRTYSLRQGDIIKVTIDIPLTNSADVRYGKDNVILKYNGIKGTSYLGSICEKLYAPIIIEPNIESK